MGATDVNGDSPISAMPAVMKCHATCKRLGLRTLESKVAIMLSKIQLQRGQPLDGLRQLDGKGSVIYTSTVERLEETTANIFNHYDNNF